MKTLCLTLTAAFAAALSLPAAAAPVYTPDHVFSAADLKHLGDRPDTFVIGKGTLNVETFKFADDSEQIVEGGLKPLIIFSFAEDGQSNKTGGSFWGKPECLYHYSLMDKQTSAVFTMTPIASDTCNDTATSIVFQHGKITVAGKVLGSYL